MTPATNRPNPSRESDPCVIVAGARTPFGKFNGALAQHSAADLGALALTGALERAGLAPETVDHVILGQVLSAGGGQLPARQAAVHAGVPLSVPTVAINKLCLSGIYAIAHGAGLIALGEADIVLAGGMESMSAAPHLLPSARTGLPYGQAVLLDHLEYDGLRDPFTGASMGALTEAANGPHGPAGQISRAEQDAYAANSHHRAAAAWAAQRFVDEVCPVPIPTRGGAITYLDHDEGVRADTSAQALSRLRPAFGATITAGSSSQISDGAAALLLMRQSRAEQLGLSWLAQILAHGEVAGPTTCLQHQPAAAIETACARAGLAPSQLDLVEISEAFAVVALASINRLGVDPARVNVDGGAIALGHPVGASGARVVLHLALELVRRGGGTGAAGVCGGGGQGDALVLRAPHAHDQPRAHTQRLVDQIALPNAAGISAGSVT